MSRLLSRLKLTELNTWFLIPAVLFILLMLGSPLFSHGQAARAKAAPTAVDAPESEEPFLADEHPQPVNLSNTPGRAAHGFTDANETLPDRNHGTGVRLGVILAAAREAMRHGRVPAVFEAGIFHQHALGHVGSVQAELLFFRERTVSSSTGTPTAPGFRTVKGLRIPLLLVINPFYNVSIHLGPQLQWQWNAPVPDDRGRAERSGARLTAGVVVGGEARVGCGRVGLRYGLPMAALSDLADAGARAGAAWKSGQVQVYLGAGL